MTASKFDWAFVTACDMPFWEASVVHELMKACSDYDAIVPVAENKAEPLFSLYRRSCLPAIESCLNRNILKVTGFYPLVRVHYLDMTPILNKGCISSRSFSNINTPDDLSEMAKD
jgi:molybdopterin-guanine dinucleotide biosynthesis protein A